MQGQTCKLVLDQNVEDAVIEMIAPIVSKDERGVNTALKSLLDKAPSCRKEWLELEENINALRLHTLQAAFMAGYQFSALPITTLFSEVA